MKYRIIKSIVIIVLVLLVASIVNYLYFWGIVIECTGGFKFSTIPVFKDIFTGIHAAQMTLGENPNNPIVGIPFVFYLYGIEPPPYVILLDIDDETESIEKIFIESIAIEYTDGQRIEHALDWDKAFASSAVLKSIGGGKNAVFPVMTLDEKLPVAVDRRESCNIRFVGYFVKKGGEKIPFDTTEYFEYEHREWRITTGLGAF